MTLRSMIRVALLATATVTTPFLVSTASAQAPKPAPKAPAKPASKPMAAAKPMPVSASKPSAMPASTGYRLTTSRDSLSYGIGVSIAQNMQQQGLTDLNGSILAQAINDVLAKKTGPMTTDQSQKVVMAYMQKQYAVRNAEAQQAGAANEKIGNAFLAENKSKPGVVTTASGLQYVVLKEGTGPKPASTDKVKVHYTGKLLDGKVFDSSVERGTPAEFPVTGVIPGWVEALQLMPVGSKWTLFIPAALAYGNRGAGQDIKPGSTLQFDVELLEIVK
jgi:FKBP-type peptidyl-prolyl cis-trans isomerase FklB